MKYYLIVGEASGDLHASHLMRSIKALDPQAQFRFYGGDLMTAVGGTRVRHFKEIAYMGIVPVLLHLRTILNARKQCKKDIIEWQPDKLILVDYADFNLSISKFVKENTRIPIHYYISPKIWAWKEWRIKQFKRYVDQMLCILPFEKDFFEGKHHYPVKYVGNPTSNEVAEFRASYRESREEFFARCGLISHGSGERPILALLAGSRMQEIKDNLPMMIKATEHLKDRFEIVLAGAPSIADDVYTAHLEGTEVQLVKNQTYALLSHSSVALVTSGTATLETCCFGVPQVVLYKTPLPKLMRFLWDHFFSVKYISLVNLIADREVVQEMRCDLFVEELIVKELDKILPGEPDREAMFKGYAEVQQKLSDNIAPDNAAQCIVS